MDNTKTCTRCSATKPHADFYRNGYGMKGVKQPCKECFQAARRADYAAKVAEREGRTVRPYTKVTGETHWCNRCHETKPHAGFSPKAGDGKGPRQPCKACTNVARRERYRTTNEYEGMTRASLERLYGLTLEEYRRMEAAQGGLCAVCNEPERPCKDGTVRRLGVDHCHATGQVRELLCRRCNTLLGSMERTPAVVDRARD